MSAVLVGVASVLAAGLDQVYTAPAGRVITYEVRPFRPVVMPESAQVRSDDVLTSDDLERTPRHYRRVSATAQSKGPAQVRLLLVDMLRREYAGEKVALAAGEAKEVTLGVEQLPYPISMLRGVRLQHWGAEVSVLSLQFACEDELVPEPEVTAQPPFGERAIQEALSALGADGGVVYLPAGEYPIQSPVEVPCDNVTIYGDGKATVLRGTGTDRAALLRAGGCTNLRFARLCIRSVPITVFRGYDSGDPRESTPEDATKKAPTTRGLEFRDCRNVRVDHCHIALFGHAGVLFEGGSDHLIDHCYFEANFQYGYGYGVCVANGAQGVYIEDNNFENHRHGIASGQAASSYIARFNRMVKDAAVLVGWQQNDGALAQLSQHEIDAHPDVGRIYAHDNYVAMRNAPMTQGASMRGNPGWLYRNVFENCAIGILCKGTTDDVWTWDNQFLGCPRPEVSIASGVVHFGEKPPDFREFPYPNPTNRLGSWPGATSGDLVPAKGEFYAGPPDAQVLARVPVDAP